ncbi:unnamed protein product [Zymoseptoria tritici ST99CH_3D1]|nr:unnamed protein product [Zymoseptoria tritici ST99CH_3D1]
MASPWPVPISGRCGCGSLEYHLTRAPMFIHCCSCHQCQRESGSTFTLNAMIEAKYVEITPASPEQIPKLCFMPTESGKGQVIARCPRCYVAVWSHYTGTGPSIAFVRTGTLDKVSAGGDRIDEVLKPGVFIFTEGKQPWLRFDDEVAKSFERYYKRDEVWPVEERERYEATRDENRQWEERGARWEELGEIC